MFEVEKQLGEHSFRRFQGCQGGVSQRARPDDEGGAPDDVAPHAVALGLGVPRLEEQVEVVDVGLVAVGSPVAC